MAWTASSACLRTGSNSLARAGSPISMVKGNMTVAALQTDHHPSGNDIDSLGWILDSFKCIENFFVLIGRTSLKTPSHRINVIFKCALRCKSCSRHIRLLEDFCQVQQSTTFD